VDAVSPNETSKDERMWAMIAHYGAFAGHVFPFAHIIVPLIIWILKKDQYPLVNDQGKESINCQISYTIYLIIAALLCLVFIGFIIFPALWLTDIILIIIAGIKANEGVAYRYPGIIRFI